MSKASATKQFLLVNSVLVNNQSEEFIKTFPSDIAQAIIGNPTLAGQRYEAFLLQVGRDLLTPPGPVEEPKTEPTIVELHEFEVNYDETIASKIAGNADPKRIGWHDREWGTDEKFPGKRKGKKRFKASAVCFHQNMPQKGRDSVERWCKDNKKILATPKEGIDLALVSPRPKLDNVTPLAMAGQFFVDASDYRLALCFFRAVDERYLSFVWLRPDEQWRDYWWFLVLEELPSEA